tara:strand:+ start:324 stop:590 length:267 start_codon:yes stop_codon:yes gene_type:complete
MKTFKDINWKDHGIKGAIQGLLMLENGIELSIVAGPGLYSLPREAGKSPDDFSKFEVAVIDKDGKFIGDPRGWQTREKVEGLIKEFNK